MDNEKLKNKFISMVDIFRERYNKLSSDEKKFLITPDSLQEPCQIYVLSCNAYDLHLILKMHSSNIPDKHVQIIELLPDKFDTQIEEFLNKPQWKNESWGDDGISKTTYFDFLLSYLVYFGKKIRDRNLDTHTKLTGFVGSPHVSFWDFAGNFEDLDLNEKAINMTQEYKKSFEHFENEIQPTISESTFNPRSSYGSCFLPFIRIGEIERSFKGQLSGSDYLQWDNIVYDHSFDSIRIAVAKSGLIGLDLDDKTQVNNILNTVFGTALLLGLPVYANRVHELASVSIRERISVNSWQFSSLRTATYDHNSRFTPLGIFARIVITNDMLNEIMQTAEKMWKTRKTIELRLLLESFTHLDNSEFLQSFYTGWIIIERYLVNLWDTKLKSYSSPMKKYLEKWDVHRILEVLQSEQIISAEDYEKMENLRTIRNKVFHSGKEPKLDEVNKCFEMATLIVRRETGINKKFDIKKVN